MLTQKALINSTASTVGYAVAKNALAIGGITGTAFIYGAEKAITTSYNYYRHKQAVSSYKNLQLTAADIAKAEKVMTFDGKQAMPAIDLAAPAAA